MPVQNTGAESPASVSPVTRLATGPPGLCGASTPRRVPRSSAIVIAVATSSTVGPGLSAMSSRTGALK